LIFNHFYKLAKKTMTAPQFPQNTILEDDFVLLRPLELADVENLLDISLNEPETWKYSLVPANGKENLINYIQLAVKARENKIEFPFIVYDKKSGKYAGALAFMTLICLSKPCS
jgi:hypothetical protein